MSTKQTTTYTVLLMRPEYLIFGANDESDTYLTTVKAEHPAAALDKARAAALEADNWTGDPLDYRCVLLIAGTHDDLNPEI